MRDCSWSIVTTIWLQRPLPILSNNDVGSIWKGISRLLGPPLLRSLSDICLRPKKHEQKVRPRPYNLYIRLGPFRFLISKCGWAGKKKPGDSMQGWIETEPCLETSDTCDRRCKKSQEGLRLGWRGPAASYHILVSIQFLSNLLVSFVRSLARSRFLPWKWLARIFPDYMPPRAVHFDIIRLRRKGLLCLGTRNTLRERQRQTQSENH